MHKNNIKNISFEYNCYNSTIVRWAARFSAN